MRKLLRQKVLSYLVEMLLVCCLHSYTDILLNLRCRQADIVTTISLPVSMTPAINYRRCRCYRGIMIAHVVVTGKQLIAGVNDTPAINYRRCRCYRGMMIAHVVVTGKQLIAGVNDTSD
jgi:hypothetical protein